MPRSNAVPAGAAPAARRCSRRASVGLAPAISPGRRPPGARSRTLPVPRGRTASGRRGGRARSGSAPAVPRPGPRLAFPVPGPRAPGHGRGLRPPGPRGLQGRDLALRGTHQMGTRVQPDPGTLPAEKCADGRRRLLREIGIDVSRNVVKSRIVRVPAGVVTTTAHSLGVLATVPSTVLGLVVILGKYLVSEGALVRPPATGSAARVRSDL